MATVKREKPESGFDEEFFGRLLQEFKSGKESLEILEKRQNDMKKQLMDLVTEHGYMDDKGHQWLKIGETELKRERRVSRSFNTAAAEAWAKANGHWDTVKEVIEVVSEEKILGLAWADKDLSDTVGEFYTEKESWAFKA
jgi:hypothetical protein